LSNKRHPPHSIDPGTKEGAGKVPKLALMHLALLQGLVKVAADLGVSKLVLGQKPRNYSIKATAISMAMVMGKLVRG